MTINEIFDYNKLRDTGKIGETERRLRGIAKKVVIVAIHDIKSKNLRDYSIKRKQEALKFINEELKTSYINDILELTDKQIEMLKRFVNE